MCEQTLPDQTDSGVRGAGAQGQAGKAREMPGRRMRLCPGGPCYSPHAHAGPQTPVLRGPRRLRISLNFSPPHPERHPLQPFFLFSAESTLSFSSSALTLPCQRLPGRHPGGAGLAQDPCCWWTQAHSGNWIGATHGAFPAETWGLVQRLFRHKPVDTRRIQEVPCLQDSALLLPREGVQARRSEERTGPDPV